jgi:hypothetical protein
MTTEALVRQVNAQALTLQAYSNDLATQLIANNSLRLELQETQQKLAAAEAKIVELMPKPPASADPEKSPDASTDS